MRVALLTREYPPEVYGGAGVHVEYLARSLRPLIDVTVQCFGADRDEPGVVAHQSPTTLAGANAALQTMGVDLAMAAAVGPGDGRRGADLVHSHTWYANLAGHVASLLHGVPHVVTVHSLEPLRPWKAEQLGGGYALSSWCERVAIESAARVVAVSAGMRDDVLAAYPVVDPERVRVIHNGIDPADYTPAQRPHDAATLALLDRLGVDPSRPAVLFVGRITRQKGVPVLLRAAASLPPDVQLVLLAGAADTPELAAEVVALVGGLRAVRTGVVWVQEMLPRPDVARVLGASSVFVCPSVYEPLGIVNLEAMACGIRRRLRCRRHPRGRRRRHDRAAGAAGRPRRPRRGAGPRARRPRRRARDGYRRPATGGGVLLLVGRGRADGRPVPGAGPDLSAGRSPGVATIGSWT